MRLGIREGYQEARKATGVALVPLHGMYRQPDLRTRRGRFHWLAWGRNGRCQGNAGIRISRVSICGFVSPGGSHGLDWVV